MNKKRKKIFAMEFVIIFILVLIIASLVDAQKNQNAPQKLARVRLIEEKNSKIANTETIQTMLNWAKSVNRNEPTLTVWNCNTKEGILLEDKQEYTLKEGDSIVLCFNEEKDVKLSLGFGIACKVGKGKCYYYMVVEEELEEPTEITFSLTMDNVEYTKTLYLITETPNL